MSKITKPFGQEQPILTPEVRSDDSGNLDVNLIIASFQEKISQLMTEIVVKDATIKQLVSKIESMKGKML